MTAERRTKLVAIRRMEPQMGVSVAVVVMSVAIAEEANKDFEAE